MRLVGHFPCGRGHGEQKERFMLYNQKMLTRDRDWDGRQLLKVEHEFKIYWFRGTKKVTELAEVPLEMYDRAEELKERVRERSRKL